MPFGQVHDKKCNVYRVLPSFHYSTREECSIAAWSTLAATMYAAFAAAPTPKEIPPLTARLHPLLANPISDGEMIQDQGTILRHAFEAGNRAPDQTMHT
jgi:hypothetical protein